MKKLQGKINRNRKLKIDDFNESYIIVHQKDLKILPAAGNVCSQVIFC